MVPLGRSMVTSASRLRRTSHRLTGREGMRRPSGVPEPAGDDPYTARTSGSQLRECRQRRSTGIRGSSSCPWRAG